MAGKLASHCGMGDEKPVDEVATLHGLGRQESEDWQRSQPRTITPEQWARFERNIGEIFEALGMEMDTPGTERTPARFLKALFDATEGYEGDPKLVTAFPTECRGGPDCHLSQVVEGPIPYYSLCEHHAFPFFGHAYVGYIAHENIIGISKLTRLVRLFARRFSVQERMGVQITETLQGILEAHGVAVYLDGTHLCTQMRGVRETDSVTRTTFWRGHYAEEPELRAEFLRICEMRSTRS
ncbi:MAG: GTP cyclohydrolase I FolE [Chloroflexi bacterium]|nr:MAG: GTP cyclohydrolase I FolE [Chloroflexota bacterium]